MSQLEQIRYRYCSLWLTATANGLVELLAQAEANELSCLSFADQLVEYELMQRQHKWISRNLRQAAGFPTEKRLEAFDYCHQTTITKRQVNALLDLMSVITWCSSGRREWVDKTHQAIGIGHKAGDAGYRVLFRNTLDLVEDQVLAEMKGELKRRVAQLARYDLLIIDELGYLPMTRARRATTCSS